jgi:hypothetical protein
MQGKICALGLDKHYRMQKTERLKPSTRPPPATPATNGHYQQKLISNTC